MIINCLIIKVCKHLSLDTGLILFLVFLIVLRSRKCQSKRTLLLLVTPRCCSCALCACLTWQLHAAKFKFLILAQGILHYGSHGASAPVFPLEFLLLPLCNEMCGWPGGWLFAWGDGSCARGANAVLKYGMLTPFRPLRT